MKNQSNPEHVAPKDALLELANVTKTYGQHKALNNVSFHLDEGEVLGLLGDNGAGKSTLIKILSGVVFPNSGEIRQFGRAIKMRSHADASKAGIETIYQDNALVGSMSIWRNMFLGREIVDRAGFIRLKETRKQSLELLERALDISGVADADKLVSSLSGGQKQAIAIARAVHFRKRIVLFDEPTSALSVRETENVLKSIKKLRSEGVSSVFITHNLFHAMQVCDRFVVMSKGEKVLDVAKEDTSLEDLTKVIVSH